MPFCPFCGSEISGDDTFCRSCGATISGSRQEPPRKKDRTKLIAVIMVLIVVMSGVTGIVIYLTKEVAFDDLERTYRWSYDGQDFSYKLTIERSYYNKMMDSDIDRGGTVSSDRYTNSNGTVFAVSDYIVVDSYIKKVSDDLASMYEERFGSGMTNDNFVNFVSVFVQICISYDYDEAESNSENWRFPLETLYEKIGDCEDTSILLAALIDAHGLKAGVVLAPGHAMCAICASEVTGSYDFMQHSPVDYNNDGLGVDYYLIETTYDEAASIGEISEAYAIPYLHLYLGNATEYYVRA